ncbi:MAG: AMP-binding protein [Planctomycetes bacterium]|nr:AMP-binding protein [Planctomycetota bacterium]
MPHPASDSASPDLLTLVRLAGARAAAQPLLAVGEQGITGAELRQRVEVAAAGLVRAGLGAGERVAVLLHRCADEAVAILATAAAGGIAVPLHGKLKDDQVRHVLADAEPFAVITSSTRLVALQDAPRTLAGHRVWRVGAEPLPGLPDATAFAALRGEPSALAPPAPSAPAVLLYTSGSTGLPKGIVQDHRNLALGAAIVAGYLQLAPTDHLLALLPLSFDYGLNQLLSALHVGCRLTAADHLGVGELAQLLRRVRPTGLAGVPSLWHEVATGLRTGVLTADHGASLRYVTNSGGALRPSDSAWLRRAWPHVRVFAMYGLTEAFRSAYLDPDEFDAHPESFGRALPGVELLLVSPTTGEVLHGPATGELVHAGALVAQGYWRRPEDTAQRFRPDPRGGGGTVVHSGDLVRRDADGRHWFVGRRDKLLKVQGHRVSPDEVAAAVAGMPGVGEVVVFGLDGGADGHRIVLVLAGDPGDAGLREQVLRRCRARLPSYMQPALVRVLPSLPHNANGKVDEGALRATMDACTGER